MRNVIGKLISNKHTTYVSGRQILDGVLVTDEIFDYAKRNKKEFLIFKAEFAQSYVCIDWNHMRLMLRSMGFGDRWMNWMEVAVFTSSMSVLVNESPTTYFQVTGGLRQGDPLPPFLFTIVTEGLAGIMRQAIDKGLYKGFKLNDSVEYSLLQFADDTIIFGDGSWSNLSTLKDLLRGFEIASGVRINLNKSNIYGIGNNACYLEACSSFLGCKIDRIPFKFLGFIVSGNQKRANFWKSVVNSLKEKLSLWKGRLVSIGGRVNLINNILMNMPSYQFFILQSTKESDERDCSYLEKLFVEWSRG